MKSRTVRSFREGFKKLPQNVRDQAREAYRRFQQNPSHPGLEFKLIRPKKRIYSVRIGIHYRALGVLDEDEIVWFWIGTHAEYDNVISQL